MPPGGLLPPGELPFGGLVVVGGGSTVKLTAKLSEMPFAPLTVTVAVCKPTGSPTFGTTVKLADPLIEMLASVVALRVKLPELGPDRAIVRSPVAWLPMLFTVTVWGVCEP